MKNTPPAWQVAIFLTLATISLGLVMAAVELVFEISSSSSSFLVSVLAALCLGMYYGSKRGELFSSDYRHTMVACWLAINLLLGFVALWFVMPEVFDLLKSNWLFIFVFVVLFAITYLLVYFAFKSGEKAGVKQFNKIQQQKQAKEQEAL